MHSRESKVEMTSFLNIDFNCKLLNLTLSYQFKTVYINFQAYNDIIIPSGNNNKILVMKNERARLKFIFSDFSEISTLQTILNKQNCQIKAVLRMINESYEPETAKDYQNRDVKVIKILSLESCV